MIDEGSNEGSIQHCDSMGLSTIAARATAALCVILTYVLGAAAGMVEGGGGGTCGAVCVCGVCMCVCVCVYV